MLGYILILILCYIKKGLIEDKDVSQGTHYLFVEIDILSDSTIFDGSGNAVVSDLLHVPMIHLICFKT